MVKKTLKWLAVTEVVASLLLAPIALANSGSSVRQIQSAVSVAPNCLIFETSDGIGGWFGMSYNDPGVKTQAVATLITSMTLGQVVEFSQGSPPGAPFVPGDCPSAFITYVWNLTICGNGLSAC
jgi:hypothetical protein